MNRLLSVIVPFYNEALVIEAFFARLLPVLQDVLGGEYEVVCVNDGSQDETLTCLLAVAAEHPQLCIVDLSRNFGKEAALTAGLDAARGDAIIIMDGDLQHPPTILPKLIEQWRNGYEVVLAKRTSRNTDSPLLRQAANGFYRVHNWLSDCKIPENVGDFRLIDRCVVDAIKRLPERRRFMKGLFAWVGFKTVVIDYEVEQRLIGRSSYNSRKLWNLALEGITSFSTVPLQIWTYIGLMMSFLALISGCWMVLKTLIYGVELPGYASLFASILFLGGIQLIGIGVLGEYIGRIYNETKQRPIYIIRKIHRTDEHTK